MISIKQITSETWPDFVSLMRSDAQCSQCWCLNHRQPSGCATGIAAQVKMKKMVEQNQVNGLLAYRGMECVGWISVDPIDELTGHDCQAMGKEGEWAIHCIYVKSGFRGLGISTELIRAAIDFSKNKGAKIISAFPIPQENRNRFPVGEAEFSGRYSTFLKFGFKSVDESSDFYQRMELENG